MWRRSVRVSTDVRLLNSRELGGVDAGHLRASPRSHSHSFVTIEQNTASSGNTVVSEYKGECLGCGGQAPYPGERPITGLKPPACLWHAAQIR